MLCSLSVTISANEKNDTYYTTNGNYYADSNTWYNSSAVMTTTSGFKYGASPNGGDINAVRNNKHSSSATVISRVRNPNGTVHSSSRTNNAYASIGALRGTDEHKYVN